jgi:hypothetical protein
MLTMSGVRVMPIDSLSTTNALTPDMPHPDGIYTIDLEEANNMKQTGIERPPTYQPGVRADSAQPPSYNEVRNMFVPASDDSLRK